VITQSKEIAMLRRINFQYPVLFPSAWDSGISPPELLEFIEHHRAGGQSILVAARVRMLLLSPSVVGRLLVSILLPAQYRSPGRSWVARRLLPI